MDAQQFTNSSCRPQFMQNLRNSQKRKFPARKRKHSETAKPVIQRDALEDDNGTKQSTRDNGRSTIHQLFVSTTIYAKFTKLTETKIPGEEEKTIRNCETCHAERCVRRWQYHETKHTRQCTLNNSPTLRADHNLCKISSLKYLWSSRSTYQNHGYFLSGERVVKNCQKLPYLETIVFSTYPGY